jgi:CO/xanthine dehydrogenase FAD-binding subunit
MHEFEVVIPENVDRCLTALADSGPEASVIAGGTDLHILIRNAMKLPRLLVHIGNMPELKGLHDRKGQISMGAAMTHREVVEFAANRGIECLAQAAGSIGSPQIRNTATAGGNLANASPAADLYPALLVLDAEVNLRSVNGTRRLPLEELVRGPGQTAIEPGEIITSIDFEKPGKPSFSGFIKVGLRDALAVSVASVALYASSADGGLDDVRIACGAVAPTPIRMKQVETLVESAWRDADLIRQVEATAADLCDPLDDIRSTGDYRRHVTGVIVARLVELALQSLVPGRRSSPDA